MLVLKRIPDDEDVRNLLESINAIVQEQSGIKKGTKKKKSLKVITSLYLATLLLIDFLLAFIPYSLGLPARLPGYLPAFLSVIFFVCLQLAASIMNKSID